MDKYIFRGKCTGTDMWVMGNLLGKDVIIPSGQPYYLDEGFIKVLEDNIAYLTNANTKFINKETEKAIKYYLKGEN